ncbi:actin binding protein [Tieghemostelium lacteum]|uniref:Actin binding protein n=1 Tax=Tieghemostelium lacteum TaxID=361077 RepID=A0A151ZRQ0_TIELA|nr:actin binding protein [Tieghemostelium lacteum]|eukprot:KYQ96657.1 actin binding protein [Tieghemostelium lacteum]
MSGDLITLKVRLVDKKVFKKFQFFPKKTVKEARLFISKELDVDPEQYGLFLPPKDDQNGIWFRDDYPLDFYGLEGENEKHDYVNNNNNNQKKGSSTEQPQPLMEFVEFKKRYRPIKVAKGDNQYKTVMVDDTMNVCDAIKVISQQVPVNSAITEDALYAMNVDEVEVLSGDMTIREQGYVGECTTGLLRTSKNDINLFVKVPFFEGWLMRKRGGGLIKGIKNWNKRWYVLKKNKLLYFKAKNVGQEMGCILMKTVQAVRPARDVTDIPTKYSKLCFEIETPARTFIMLANNSSELKKWIETLDFSRRMFAYETHFFGVAQRKLQLGAGGNRMSLVIKDGEYDDDSDDEVIDVKQKEEQMERERLAKEEKEKKQQEEEERVRKEEIQRQERLEQERLEREKKIREEEEKQELERLERERKIKEEEERQELERLEREKKIKEEQELLQKQQEEFIQKQQQLELEKQKQLQDQIEEDRRLEELMIQMELDQEERIKIREEQERLEQEKIELQKKLEEEERQLQQERERIQLEQERLAKEKQEELERQEREEKERQERIEQERIEQEREEKERQERIEQERIEQERIYQEEQEKIKEEKERKIKEQEEEERQRQEELLKQQEEEEEVDLEEFEREEEEKEKEQLAAKKLRSLHARLEAVEAETPDLKLLLSESSLSSPENLLLSWANYIISGRSPAAANNATGASGQTATSGMGLSVNGQQFNMQAVQGGGQVLFSHGTSNIATQGSQYHSIQNSNSTSFNLLSAEQAQQAQLYGAPVFVPIKDLKSVEANVEMYANLLHKLEPTEFSVQAYQKCTTIQAKAELIVETLQRLGVSTVQVEHVLNTDPQVQLGVLLTIYEEVGGQWQEDFQTQVVQKRGFATKYIGHLVSTMGTAIKSMDIHIPSDPHELIPSLLDGRILCYLINKVYPGTIDERVIDKTKKTDTSVGNISKNLYIALNASKALGADHQETYKTIQTLNSTSLHNLIWSIVETCLLQSADPNKNRHLFNLARAETRNAFRSLDKEKIMLRWFNYHLRKGPTNRSINNFTDDVEDCENYAYLFDRIAPQVSRKAEILKEPDWEKRAEMVLDMASKIGCMPLLTSRDIVESENSKLNMLFVADIMRVCHCLPNYELRKDVEELDDQVQKSKDQGNNDTELLQWINSLQMEGVDTVSNLLDDFKSGYVFLKIFEKIAPANTVDAKRIKTNPTSVFKMVELCNYTMDICRNLKLPLAGIAGTDLVNGDIRANRAILNQIRRSLLGERSTIDSVTAHQAMALKWANSKVVNKKVKNIQSFKDQFLQDSLFFLELIQSIDNRCVIDRQLVATGLSSEDQEANARYFLTSSWGVGVPLNVLWEDVAKVRSKSIKHIIETLQFWDNEIQQNNNNN